MITLPEFDITDDIVALLGVPTTAQASTADLVPDNIRWDCKVGGIPFLFAFNDSTPFRRETADFRRQRIDQERNPGEQSLDSGMWIRSQASWHYGSGLTSAEPLEVSEQEAQFRYQSGGGVNPWTAGVLSLLNSTEQVVSASASTQLALGVNTGVLHAASATLTYVPTSGASATVAWGGTGAITSMTSDGANYYVADTTGIYKGLLPTGAGSKIWNTGDTTVIRYVKSRLMATVGKGIYELSASAGPALPTALDPGTARPAGWTWTDIAEGPVAIYLSGYVGDTSTIERISVDTTTTTVTLDQPTVVADMPRSELVFSLYSYVGGVLIVGTSKGARVASISSTGTLALGPLVVQCSDGCRDAVADGQYVYVTAGSKGNAGNRVERAGLFRIDLGTNLNNDPLQFATAADLVAPASASGACHQVTTAGGKLWFTVSDFGLVRQTSTFVSEGWLETGRIRLGTVENKAWRDLRLLGGTTAGSSAAYASLTGTTAPSTWNPIISVDQTNTDQVGSLSGLTTTVQPNLYVAFKLSASDTSVSPFLIGYQVRAIPAPRRTQLLQIPLLCFDFEVDRQGARFGKPGNSFARFSALKTLETSSATVQWQDYTTGEAAEAYVERVTYARTTPPTRQVSGNGGIITLLLRLV